MDELNLIKSFLNNKTDDQVETITKDWWEAIGDFPEAVWYEAKKRLVKACMIFMVTPGEFRKMCEEVEPEELGYASTKQAYTECYFNIHQQNKITQPRRWSHPTVFIASEALRAENCGRGISEHGQFKKAYLAAIYRDLNGSRLPCPPVVLPMLDRKQGKSDQCANSHLAKLKSKFGGSTNA
ncbi:hypothetical protein BGC07_18505 [Piscirickettsia litoralis]|uniref:Uncharacterized protein n=1 Tax=Piscirickettsia litoralis TaxID=1891921 RepID=A0ABX2ZX05_9GAMM|nr:hypothetical protein BGC07_18505 [Piscirickettsia litoralis]